MSRRVRPRRRRRLEALGRLASASRCLFATSMLSLLACSSNLLVIGGAGSGASGGATSASSTSTGVGGTAGAGGGAVSCSSMPSALAMIGPLMPVTPVVSGTSLYYVVETATQRAVERVSLGDGSIGTVGIVGLPGPNAVPQTLAVDDGVYLLSSSPFAIALLPKSGGLPASVPVPGWPATMLARASGGIGWVRIDQNSTFTASPFTYGETAKGPTFTTDDVHRFDDDPAFPPIAMRQASDPGFPELFGDGASVRYTVTLPTEILVGSFDGASGLHTIALHEPRTPATCLPGETPTTVGGPVGAWVWAPAVEPTTGHVAYWITRSNDCQAGAAPPVNRTTAELVALDTDSGARRVLVPPTSFPWAKTSPGPLAIDAGDVFYAPPAGPAGLVRQPFAGGPETQVLTSVEPVFTGVVGPCVVVVDAITSPARVVTIERNAPPQ